MNSWRTYTSERPYLKTEGATQQYILDRLGACIDQFFSFEKPIRPQRTRLIKETLTLLGHQKLPEKKQYKVYSHGLSQELCQEHGGEFKNVEWLYDLHWYTEVPGEDFMTNELPLVVECEWNPRFRNDPRIPYGGIKYDFQKLLVTNAELRLMIFIIKKDCDLERLDDYFEKAIDNYQHLRKDAKFLFVAYDEQIKGFHYTEKRKRPHPNDT